MLKLFNKKKKPDEFQPTENIFDQLVKTNKRQTYFIVLLLGLLFFTFKSANKPPIVVRLYEDGSSQIMKNYRSENQVSKEDLQIFTDSFIRKMNLIDSFHLKERLNQSLNMMSESLKEEYLNDVLTKENLGTIKDLEWETETKILRRKYAKENNQIKCEITYIRAVQDKKNNREFSIPYRGEIVIALAERSEAFPFGLKVTGFDHERIETN
tara:strand:+ start:428 stop:1060 length:633 start_codon:yes stop_codon:yes gene_type:complete